MLRQMGVFVETEGERQTAKRQTSDLLALRPGDPNTRTLHFVRVPADSSLPLEDMDATMYVAALIFHPTYMYTHVATRRYFPPATYAVAYATVTCWFFMCANTFRANLLSPSPRIPFRFVHCMAACGTPLYVRWDPNHPPHPSPPPAPLLQLDLRTMRVTSFRLSWRHALPPPTRGVRRRPTRRGLARPPSRRFSSITLCCTSTR